MSTKKVAINGGQEWNDNREYYLKLVKEKVEEVVTEAVEAASDTDLADEIFMVDFNVEVFCD